MFFPNPLEDCQEDTFIFNSEPNNLMSTSSYLLNVLTKPNDTWNLTRLHVDSVNVTSSIITNPLTTEDFLVEDVFKLTTHNTCSPTIASANFLGDFDLSSDDDADLNLSTHASPTRCPSVGSSSVLVSSDVKSDSPKQSGADFSQVLPNIKILYANAQSINNKIDELRVVTLDREPDLIAITESWTNENIDNAVLKIDGYSLL